MKKRHRAPRIGTLLYQAGWKKEPPGGPFVTTFVYCGVVRDHEIPMHLLVPYETWWGLTQGLKRQPDANDGLKVRTLGTLYGICWTWEDVRRFAKKVPDGPQPDTLMRVQTNTGLEILRIPKPRKRLR